jgi:hypothetical protein
MTQSKADQLRALREAKFSASQRKITCLQAAPASPSSKAKVNPAAKVAKAKAALNTVTNVTNTPVTNIRDQNASSDKDRVIRWRNENPDQYRETQRELMRKRRAAKKES